MIVNQFNIRHNGNLRFVIPSDYMDMNGVMVFREKEETKPEYFKYCWHINNFFTLQN